MFWRALFWYGPSLPLWQKGPLFLRWSRSVRTRSIFYENETSHPPDGAGSGAVSYTHLSLIVIMAKSEEDYVETTLGELLPYGFGPRNLELDPV